MATYTFQAHRVVESTTVDLCPYRGMHMAFDPIVSELEGIREAI
jgi:hypothetical protein